MLSVIASLLPLLHCQALAAGEEDVTVIISYPLDGLPVWSVDAAGEPQFDASLLIAHIKGEVEPEGWKVGEVDVIENAEGNCLVAVAPRNLHKKISQFLARQHAFARHDVEAGLQENLATAADANQQVLLFAAEPNSKETGAFFAARFDEKSPESLKAAFDNFVIQCMSPTQAKSLSCWGELPPPAGSPRLAVLRADGSVVALSDFAEFCESGLVKAERLSEFLSQHAQEFCNAKETLQAALSQASREDKRVLVQMGGPNCAPCIMLTRYLDSQSELMSKDFIRVKLDNRMPHSAELSAEFVDGVGVIPWMAILSSDGEVLANSVGEEGNIGFPSGDAAKAHFRKMLTTTRRHLSDAEIESIVEAIP